MKILNGNRLNNGVIMGKIRELLKKLLPPPVKSFMRESNRLANMIVRIDNTMKNNHQALEERLRWQNVQIQELKKDVTKLYHFIEEQNKFNNAELKNAVQQEANRVQVQLQSQCYRIEKMGKLQGETNESVSKAQIKDAEDHLWKKEA